MEVYTVPVYNSTIVHLFVSYFLTDLLVFGFGKMENESSQGFRNRKSWALKSGIQLMESGIPLTIGTRVQVPLTTNLLHGADYIK